MRTRTEKAIETLWILLIIIISYAGGLYIGWIDKCKCNDKIEKTPSK